jgi:hypothetical protein
MILCVVVFRGWGAKKTTGMKLRGGKKKIIGLLWGMKKKA